MLLREKEAFQVVKDIAGNIEAHPLPEELLSTGELGKYMDRAALNVALTLQPGEVSDPIRTVDGFHVLQLQERRRHENASFESCRADVEADYWAERMRLSEEASAADLRKTAAIQLAELRP
jgi:parvulin-like peptidyl-prolyl isomerase